jgi:hypothetical protein
MSIPPVGQKTFSKTWKTKRSPAPIVCPHLASPNSRRNIKYFRESRKMKSNCLNLKPLYDYEKRRWTCIRSSNMNCRIPMRKLEQALSTSKLAEPGAIREGRAGKYGENVFKKARGKGARHARAERAGLPAVQRAVQPGAQVRSQLATLPAMKN